VCHRKPKFIEAIESENPRFVSDPAISGKEKQKQKKKNPREKRIAEKGFLGIKII